LAVTDKARTIGISLMAVLFCACCGTRVQAAEVCHTPTPQALITWYNTTHPEQRLRYSQQNSLIYHPIEVFQTERPRINWIGLAWLSPEWGTLFAANCDGEPLAALSVGAVGKIMAGPVLPALGQTVMFVYVDKETSDCVHDSIDIVAVKDGRIISLWRHGYKQGMNVGHSKMPFNDFITQNYAVNFGDDGQTIQVAGKVLAYPYRKDGSQSPTPSATNTLPAETYHWDPKSLRFLPEQHYRQTAPCVLSDRPSTK